MSKHSTVLGNAYSGAKLLDMQPPLISVTIKPCVQQEVYDKLAAMLFRPRLDGKRAVLAFCAAQQGAGVSSIVRGVATSPALAEASCIVVDQELRTVSMDETPARRNTTPSVFSLFEVGDVPKPEVSVETVNSLRGRFDCVLIDCGSIETNTGVMRFASSCDGVILVAEAGRSSRKLLKRAVQTIGRAQGKLLGIVLNKRRYPIPGWLHKILHVS